MMEPAQSPDTDSFISLKQASEILKVSVETLLEWNNSNILKPIITKEGEVGYKKDQLDKFLSIQKIPLKVNDPSPVIAQETHPDQVILTSPKLETHPEIAPVNVGTRESAQKPEMSKTGSWQTFALVFSFVAAGVLMTVLLLSHQVKPTTVPSPESLSSVGQPKNAGDQKTTINNVALIKTQTNNSLTNKNLTASNINDENNAYTDNRLSGDYLSNNSQPATPAANVNTYVPLTPVLGINTNGDFSDPAANFTSRTNTSGNNSVFDDKGNIKEDAVKPDALATTLSANGFEANGTPFKQTLYPTLLTLGLLLIVFGFASQPTFAPDKNAVTDTVHLSMPAMPGVQKVLEIAQKPDGSVVLYFQGDEHKISKPELNSETDQFIQRLMTFASDDTKEINYNILKDDKIKLNAPLSKLVTRLGFVGLKRDLFFPRTSKNRVIFRRYLTHQDLVSLGITPNQITDGLLN